MNVNLRMANALKPYYNKISTTTTKLRKYNDLIKKNEKRIRQ